jgi:3'-phosphoadenosine 5'-phosphosulfate sulfotransferase (PAPS reductase)/FAD synthetase
MEEKLRYSINLVEKAFAENNISRENKGVLAFSGGIDSTCVLNLPPVLAAVKEGILDLLFNDTLVEFPHTRRFVKKVQEELGVDIIIAKPKMTFKQVVKKYGFPVYKRAGRNPEESRATSMCCYHLKKAPTNKMIKKHAWSLYLTGMRADESYNRRSAAKIYGDYFVSKTYGFRKCHPVLYWSIKDVWEFQKKYSFDYNELYDKVTYLNDNNPDFSFENAKKYQVRTGCWCCPQGFKYGKFKWMREYFPKMFRTLMINMGLGETILDMRIKKNKNIKSKRAMLLRDVNYKELFGVERALDLHPCYFDSF